MSDQLLLFNSQNFLLFFTAVFAVYWLVRNATARVWVLLAASVFFYAVMSKKMAALICLTTVFDYAVARWIETTACERRRKLLLAGSVTVNLGVLAFFKYCNFFLESVRDSILYFGGEASWGVTDPGRHILDIWVPVGVSFFTFEAISYVVDVYRRRIAAEKNLAHFLLFILFFPHLVAGPIVRGRDFLPQVRRPKRWDWLRMQHGVQLFLMGLFKKMAIADRMAAFVDPVFAEPTKYGSGAVWVAAVAYAVKIYCDFSGYTDMALGSAHLLGYKLKPNFNMPYLAANVTEFWHRWHISLSTWLRDYLFIPLGGSRGSKWFTARNLMLTMVLGGLWHGGQNGVFWTFLVWGALHGLYLIGHRLFRDWCADKAGLVWALATPPGYLLRAGLTFFAVLIGWVFFRASSLAVAGTMLQRMFVPTDGAPSLLHQRSLWYTVAVMAICHVVAVRGLWRRYAPQLPAPVLGASYALVLTMAQVLAPADGQTFEYFRF